MARQLVERVVSDLSGEEIAPGKGWTMTLTPADGRKNLVRLDITDAEAQAFVGKGVEVKRRGRRPGSGSKTRNTASGNGRRHQARTSTKRKTLTNGRRKRGTRVTTPKTRAAQASSNGRRKRRTRSS